MNDPAHDLTTPFDGDTPRRDAVRAMGAAGAALLGVVGLGAATQAQGRRRNAGAATQRKKCRCPLIGLTFAVSKPFSLGANEGTIEKAVCPKGFLALSGGLQGTSDVTSACLIRESHTISSGREWVINVFCTEAANTDLFVGALCFGMDSFRKPGPLSFQP